jgi:hypothetical protein
VNMAEVLELIRKVIEEVTKEVKIEAPLTDEEKAKARSLLSAFVRQFWVSPLGLKLKNELSAVAQEYGSLLEDTAKRLGISDAYKAIAEKTAIGKKFKLTWGKPVR